MKNLIFYFSGTGNSLALARQLAAHLDEPALYDIAKIIKDLTVVDFSRAETIGIVTPVYAYGAPAMVEEFCRTLPPQFYTYGIANFGTSPGITLTRLRAILQKNAGDLSGEFYIAMPENFIPIFKIPSAAKQQALFEAAGQKLSLIAEAVKKHRKMRDANPARRGIHRFIRTAGKWAFSFLDYGFRVSDRCTGCTLCAKVCPAGNITMRAQRPQWHHKCALCIACLQWCPVKAINFSSLTQKKERYRHPSVKADDLIRTP
jgi:ferredoxin/flavodoxin